MRDVPTVLIADADDEVLSLLSFALASEFDLMRARDGEQALRLALIEHPDLVVLDVHMPKLDGYRVAGQIRRNPATCETPVILLDAHPERIDVSAWLRRRRGRLRHQAVRSGQAVGPHSRGARKHRDRLLTGPCR